MKLSVIIVNYNVKYFLEQCLRSVFNAGSGLSMEVFVVDNNSVDGSVEMVRQKFPDVRLIANKENTGFSKANNQAIRESSGEYVLLLNPDTVVEEDTFTKCIGFMDAHQDAGGLGVKMIDGSGKFLPESKRGLPTPAVAFYKIFGLAALFPKSHRFGSYHQGFLDENETNPVDVLAGAYMLIRRVVLDKIGLLDEDFFMYGEDIDLSYRIQKAGYKNYYFPETRIIHYKGESTKKSSVNYVFVFYNAMIIFARKHFSRSNASLFSFFIHLAIYLRAGVAVFSRLAKRLFLPAIDFVLVFVGMYLLKNYWSDKVNVHYPEFFIQIFVPFYILIWLGSVFFSGGFDRPIRFSRVVRGVVTGTILILVIYALLPEHLRFSRALTLMGSAWAAAALILDRIILHALIPKTYPLYTDNRKKLLIVGEEDEATRVLSVLKMTGTSHNFLGFVSPGNRSLASISGEHQSFLLGPIDKLTEMVKVFSPDEIIFCARDIPSHRIIHLMSDISGKDVEFKIAPPESMFIIGSSSIDNPGELYVVDINSIGKASNRRNKRMLDIGLSVLFLLIAPLLLFMQRNPAGFLMNIFKVMGGSKSWVGFSSEAGDFTVLPKLRPGVLSPVDALRGVQPDTVTLHRLNALYAKDYHVSKDLGILRYGLRNLGR